MERLFSQMKLIKKRAAVLLLSVLILPGLTGCWYAAAAGAGAYGGYKAKEAGYTLQNPVKKESSAKKSSSQSETTKQSDKQQ
jgi:hypothetical protein